MTFASAKVRAGSNAGHQRKEAIMKIRSLFSATALAALLAGPAMAQESQPTVSGSLAATPVVPTGLSLQAGGGVTGFSREESRDRFGTGGYWDVRAVLGTRSFLGAELAYVGSARQAGAAGLDSDASLVGNGVEAVARGNLPLQLNDRFRLTPFVFGGAGWTYYQVVNSDANASAIKDNANAFVIPFGAGISASYRHFTADARFTYRSVFDDDLVAMNDGHHADLQNWAAGLTVGYEF
jgi:hypothetical protein